LSGTRNRVYGKEFAYDERGWCYANNAKTKGSCGLY
jgi:hypothetical protein